MQKELSGKNYISVAEFAKMLGISRIAVFKRIQKGQIPAEKIGRSYAIPIRFVSQVMNSDSAILTEDKKKEIKDAVAKVIKEYGETLKLLGKE